MLEKVDEQLIAHLQRNGRATVAELGQAIGLSASSSWRRMQALEQAGVITGYAAFDAMGAEAYFALVAGR